MDYLMVTQDSRLYQVQRYYINSEILYTFTPNKSYDYLLNDEPSNLVFLKT